ncbi:uncharacterized protein [Musca autumnalis]|uniref:uncharacterized protein n=1 Tax=Musca autumnalis TaxID=221902 RepID=UPI003CEA601D
MENQEIYNNIATGASSPPYNEDEKRIIIIKALLSKTAYINDQRLLGTKTPNINIVEEWLPNSPMGFANSTISKLRQFFENMEEMHRACVMSFAALQVDNEAVRSQYCFLLTGIRNNWTIFIGTEGHEYYTTHTVKEMVLRIYNAAESIGANIVYNVCHVNGVHRGMLPAYDEGDIYYEGKLWAFDIYQFIVNIVKAFKSGDLKYRGTVLDFTYVDVYCTNAEYLGGYCDYDSFKIESYQQIFNYGVVRDLMALAEMNPEAEDLEGLNRTIIFVSAMAEFLRMLSIEAGEKTINFAEKLKIIGHLKEFLDRTETASRTLFFSSLTAWEIMLVHFGNINVNKLTTHCTIEKFVHDIRVRVQGSPSMYTMSYAKRRFDAALERTNNNEEANILFYSDVEFPK